MTMVCIDDLVQENHLLRKIDKSIDWDFIYELVLQNKKYASNNKRYKYKYESMFFENVLVKEINKDSRYKCVLVVNIKQK